MPALGSSPCSCVSNSHGLLSAGVPLSRMARLAFFSSGSVCCVRAACSSSSMWAEAQAQGIDEQVDACDACIARLRVLGSSTAAVH